MSNTCTFARSFADLSDGSVHRLRAFLDTADSASPYQDPLFFGGRGVGEVDCLLERDGRAVFFALCFENVALSRLLPGLRALIVHKGPVADDPDAMMSGLRAIKELAHERRLCEIHISPQIKANKACPVQQACGAVGFQPLASPSPNMTLILDIARDFDQITAGFRKATRYEVNRAGRIGMAVRRAETEADFLRFHQIYQQRASHKGFAFLSVADFAALSERMRAVPERCALLLSEYKGDILAGAVLVRAGPRVHYLYGATAADKAGNRPGLYPVFRRAIEWAKEIGCTEFDFGGYGPSGSSSVRRFKEGFGGEVRNFGPAYSLALMPYVPKLRRALGLFRS